MNYRSLLNLLPHVTWLLLLFAEPAVGNDKVLIKDVIPMRILYESMGPSSGTSPILVISDVEIQLQRFDGGQLKTVASMPTDLKLLQEALVPARKDFFRGTVSYTDPYIRDGCRIRMITPLGDITEYGVFFSTPDPEKWPQAIVSLEPLFRLFNKWSATLSKLAPESPTE